MPPKRIGHMNGRLCRLSQALYNAVHKQRRRQHEGAYSGAQPLAFYYLLRRDKRRPAEVDGGLSMTRLKLAKKQAHVKQHRAAF